MQSENDNSVYIAKHHDEGMRLDNFLAFSLQKAHPGVFSRAMITEMIRGGQVLHNQEPATKPDKKILMNDRVTCQGMPLSSLTQAQLKPQSTVVTLDILFEDEEVLFVNKPAGLLTHAVREGDVSLTEGLLRHCPQIAQVGGDILRPGIVHRLDRGTSGVLVIAKTEPAFIELKRLFEAREIEKTYFAVVEGHLSQVSGSIDFPITRIPHSEKRSIRRATSDTEARSALTFFQLLKRFEKHDFVEVKPKTGRTHQIRIHFSALQHPIVGDRLYGFRRQSGLPLASRPMLHAGRLVLSLFGKVYDMEAPLPSDFTELLGSLTVSE
jgi:23S rRNA pseudouridine1911/1915/1917 synthase